METFVCLVYIAVASFVVLAQPAVAQGSNITLPLAYPGQVLQGDGSRTCHSEEQLEIVRNEVDNAVLSLLDESKLLPKHSFVLEEYEHATKMHFEH